MKVNKQQKLNVSSNEEFNETGDEQTCDINRLSHRP